METGSKPVKACDGAHFGDWQSFDDCVVSMMAKEGYSRETAEKVCGKLRSELSKAEPVFDIAFEIDPKAPRRIWGLASCPDIDRENEIVLKSAIEGALKWFMKHPVLHLYHSERPVGTILKAWFADEALHIEAQIYDTPDTDDVWAAIEKGDLCMFSIYGRRREASEECSIPPDRRISPCITKSLWLDSISICPRNSGINPRSFAEVVKSLDIRKATDSGSCLQHTTVDGTEKEKRIEKMADGEPTQEPTAEAPTDRELLEAILATLQEIKAAQSVEKSDAAMEEEKPEEVQKARNAEDEIRKAVAAAIEEARAEDRKAIADLKAEIETLKKAVAPKQPIVLPEGDLKKADDIVARQQEAIMKRQQGGK